MATSYNACSPVTSFSAPKESSSVAAAYRLSSTHSPSSSAPPFQSHSALFNRLPGSSHTPSHSAQCQSYPSAYNLNTYGHYEAATMDHPGLVQTYFSSTPVSSSSSFSSSLASAYSAPSPQPSLYQVPPQFRQSASPVNSYPGRMAKYGLPVSSAFSPVSSNTLTAVALPSSSFSFSPRNIRSTAYTTTASTVDPSDRFSFSATRKSSQLSHYSSARPNKADILLDRKAFISLEKSINWQAALPCSTSAPLTPPAQHPSPGSSSPLQCPLDSTNFSQGQSYQLTSPRFTQVTSVVQAVSDCSKENTSNSSFSLSDGHWNAGNAERDFTLPGMKDVPAWLKLLRLHKYAPFFARMSYEEMLELTEDVLEHRNITKGARQKLILSIQKLKARSTVLLASEHELLDTKGQQYRSKISYSSLSQVLFQIRAFLSTPIRPLMCRHGSSSSFSFLTPLCPSSCSTCRPGHASSVLSEGHSFLSSPHVDFNNNNNSISSSSSYHGECQTDGTKRTVSPVHNEVLVYWSFLNNEDLPDIMTRLIGHVHYILVKKCKKRLKTLNLWKEHFKGIHDELPRINLPERDVFEQFARCVESSNEQVALSVESDQEENEKDEDSGLLDFNHSSVTLSADGHNTTTSTHFGSPSSTPNGTEDKDSGVDEAAGDSDTGSLHSDTLTAEEEEELYMALRSVLDKCISHEAFWPHQKLFRHWRQQLQCMISALRYLVTDCTTSTAAAAAADGRSVSPFTLKKLPSSGSENYAGSYLPSRYLGCSSTTVHCKSPVPPAQQQQSPNVLGGKTHKATGAFQSYKKPLTSLSINNNSNILYPSKTNSSPALSVGRRLLHNRLRSSTGGTAQQQQQQLSQSTSSCMSSSSSLYHRSTVDQLQMSSAEESTGCHAHFAEQRTASGKLSSTGKSVDSGAVIFQGAHCTSSARTYSNLSVIPQLSSALLSCAPLSALNLNPNAAGNSPEANLRNLLLQLTSQQQHSQLPTLQQPASPAASSPSNDFIKSHHSNSAVNESDNSDSMATWHSSSLFDSLLADSSRTCSNNTHKDNNDDGGSCCFAADEDKQPHDFDNGNDNLYSLWSLNGQVLGNDDSGEAKKAADWKAATGLLSSLDLCSGDGHHLEDMLSNLLDTTSDISLSTIGSWESTAKCPPPETGTTFNDIEQLCIRMAEHALDISDDSVFS